MKKSPEHAGRKIATHVLPNSIPKLARPYEATNPNTARQYDQKRSEYDTHNQIKPEITYKKIVMYALMFLSVAIILNFTLAILMGKI